MSGITHPKIYQIRRYQLAHVTSSLSAVSASAPSRPATSSQSRTAPTTSTASNRLFEMNGNPWEIEISMEILWKGNWQIAGVVQSTHNLCDCCKVTNFWPNGLQLSFIFFKKSFQPPLSAIIAACNKELPKAPSSVASVSTETCCSSWSSETSRNSEPVVGVLFSRWRCWRCFEIVKIKDYRHRKKLKNDFRASNFETQWSDCMLRSLLGGMSVSFWSLHFKRPGLFLEKRF